MKFNGTTKAALKLYTIYSTYKRSFIYTIYIDLFELQT